MIGHDDTTSSLELDRVGKKLFGKQWLGVVPSDRVPSRRPNSYLIANLHTAAMPGLHWVCRYVDENGNSAWHDPLAQLGQAQRRRHDFERHVRQWTDEAPAPHDQEASEYNCGQRCLAALCVAQSSGFQAYVML